MKQAVVAFRSNRFMQFVLAVLTFAILLPAHSASRKAPRHNTAPTLRPRSLIANPWNLLTRKLPMKSKPVRS